MAPACGDDSSVCPARVSSGLSASRARAANQGVIAFPISQLTSRTPQLIRLLPAAAGLGTAARDGEGDVRAASRTGVVTVVGAVAGRAGGAAGQRPG
jgi:hypothetical protein